MSKTKKTIKKSKQKSVRKEEIKTSQAQQDLYYEGTGRRKTAVALVRLFPQKSTNGRPENSIIINEKPLEKYFPLKEWQDIVLAPLILMNCLNQFRISVKIKGGGVSSQAEAVRHGVSRALVLFNPDFRKKLKEAGYLKRDPRMRERKKFGLKRARRAPQWQKR
ncbi:MAG: 30S ribosomal protein S9 [Minisyncoccales bacterium]